ncbi:MAG: primase-helicase family protein [Bacteroidota bacterium]
MAKSKKDLTEPIQEEKDLSYFDQRMKLLGVTPEINKIALYKYDAATQKNVLEDSPIFQEVEEGIRIMVYTLDRSRITFSNQETKIKESGHEVQTGGSRWKKDFYITRLREPIVKGNDVIKYRIPKGGGTYPFFPPALIEKFEQKIPMKTVFLTEGYFKAFKASMHGIDIIGLSSITHMKDKATGALHEDIIKLIKSGLVERFVWLVDGDCLDITQKEITEDKDLYTRPSGFFRSITSFKDLLDDYQTIDKWFMHIDIDNIIQDPANKGMTRDLVKGLDDLLITFKGRETEITDDLVSISKNGFYFRKFNISHSTYQVKQHFHIGTVDDFFLFHLARRPELKSKEFKFVGTKYLYSEEEGKCKIQTPGEANLYFRVGDDYYKYIEKPNQHGDKEKVITERKKSTLTDDHGKNFCKHVPKYEAFCNVPDHNNFKQVLYNCFNIYSPLDHHPDEDECFVEDFPAIMNLIQHIFGDRIVSFRDKETGEKKEYKTVELGLDYLQILYQKPAQKLPILCLVSKENSTGKSTLGFFLRNMLGANVAIVGNADLAGDFNAHWAGKSVVICDEAKIDKQHVIEKIKALSTAKKIFMNAKGRGQVELDCFIKFLLITNNEETFIYASEEDIRYWVIKVPVLKTEDPRILDKLVDEIPAFLSFLNRRTLATEEKSRMWFHPQLLITDAFRRVVAYSQPTIEKELRSFFKELFLVTGLDQILMTQDVIHKEVFNKKYERNYLSNVLTDRLKLKPVCDYLVDGIDKKYKTEEEAVAAAEIRWPELKGYMVMGKIQAKGKVMRYSYPSYQEKITEGGVKQRERVEVSEPPGRPFLIKRNDFVTDAESASIDLGAENEQLKETLANTEPETAPRPDAELPFG